MKIEIEPTSRGNRGQRYRVTYQGDTLCESRNPELDACRALLARGVTGTLEVWHRGATHAASRIDIAEGAKWTITEADRAGLMLVTWKPFQYGDESAVPIQPIPPSAAILEKYDAK